ncbi:MAG: ABC transporter substrate-binding protein, partial [Nonomuraea sp.]|nr:ABC transporter substrate-binding protein [Nonomuraea sp.]
ADSADPGDMYTSTAMSMARLYGRSLTMFKPGTTTVVPDLAASLGKTTDGRTWTYTLRAGLKFATGQPISAKDVKYAILRSMDERLPNGSSYFDTQLDLPDGYRGLPADTRPVTAIETPDDRTIVFRLKQPMAEFDYVATLPETIPVPQPADPKTYRANVVSSGPYMFDGAATADHLKLKRNPYWSAQTDPNRPALPDAYDIAANVTDGDDRLINGTSEYGAPIPATQAAKLAPVKDRVDTVTSIVRYLAINPQAGALTNTECRLAVAAALDLDAIRLALGSGDHHGDVPTSLIPPYVPGNHFRTPGHDVEAARAHLTKCGKPKGFSTTFVYRDQPADQALALAVQASLAKVGILVTLKQVDSSTFLGKTGGNPSWLKEQQVGLIPGRWLPDFPTSAGFLAPLVDSRQILENGYSLNVSVRLFAVDKLIDQARAELDRAKRDALWYQIEQQVAESGELVPLLWDRSILLRGKDATNQHVDPVYQGYDLLTMGVRS